jgi:hypothetical protein
MNYRCFYWFYFTGIVTGSTIPTISTFEFSITCFHLKYSTFQQVEAIFKQITQKSKSSKATFDLLLGSPKFWSFFLDFVAVHCEKVGITGV